jgi:hypothetical protein
MLLWESVKGRGGGKVPLLNPGKGHLETDHQFAAR